MEWKREGGSRGGRKNIDCCDDRTCVVLGRDIGLAGWLAGWLTGVIRKGKKLQARQIFHVSPRPTIRLFLPALSLRFLSLFVSVSADLDIRYRIECVWSWSFHSGPEIALTGGVVP